MVKRNTSITTFKELEEVINKARLLLVEFYSPTCGACKMFEKQLDEFEKLKNIKIVQIDINKIDSAFKQKYKITSVPKTFIYKKGRDFYSFSGYKTVEHLKLIIEGMK